MCDDIKLNPIIMYNFIVLIKAFENNNKKKYTHAQKYPTEITKEN